MRVTTHMIYDAGRIAVQKKTNDLLRVQQQLATGKKILRPSDDPVAAAHALEVTQAASLNTQFAANQKAARDVLALSEGHMQSIQGIYERVHELTVQLGNTGSLTDSDRRALATELRMRFDELMGLANETDGLGTYLYSGFRGDIKPFSGTPDTGVIYNGDDGQRFQRIGASSQVAVSDTGSDMFMNIVDDSIPFHVQTDSGNVGTATIGGATITDTTKWNSALNHQNFAIKFAKDAAGVVTYDIVDDQGISVLTNAASVPTPALPGTGFQSGVPISIKTNVVGGNDFGATVVITGSPENGDTYYVRPNQAQSVFKTISDLILAVEAPLSTSQGSNGTTTLVNAVNAALSNIQAAEDNLGRVQTTIGSRMNEIDSMASANSQRELTYKEHLSSLQDVDYTEAITNMNKNQVTLEAAQKSFASISQLSLFRYI